MTTTSVPTTEELYGSVGAGAYHDLVARDTSEVAELRRAVRDRPGSVLELAAGTGRLTLPLLALGREVTALDLSASMCRLLRERLDSAPATVRKRCTVVEADMTTFRLARRFAVVVLGTTSVSLLDEAARPRLYERVKEHLAPGGAFVISTRSVDRVGSAVSTRVTGASGRTYTLSERWVDRRTREVRIRPESGPGAGVDLVSTVHDLPSAQLEAELAASGLTVRRRREVPTAAGSEYVVLEAEVAGP